MDEMKLFLQKKMIMKKSNDDQTDIIIFNFFFLKSSYIRNHVHFTAKNEYSLEVMGYCSLLRSTPK